MCDDHVAVVQIVFDQKVMNQRPIVSEPFKHISIQFPGNWTFTTPAFKLTDKKTPCWKLI